MTPYALNRDRHRARSTATVPERAGPLHARTGRVQVASTGPALPESLLDNSLSQPMESAVGELLPVAVGVALSPVPVRVVILMLLSKAASGNSLTFLLGQAAGLVMVSAIVLTFAPPEEGPPIRGPRRTR
jgi:hypothetical protein